MGEPLVSIISPCWNGEKYVARMLESILYQSYKNIELLCIDDGSTDNTQKIILSYVEKFEKQGMSLIYTYQENQGQAAALNAGIKKITGDFLTWIDCDDYLKDDSVEKRVKMFEIHPDCSVVTSNLYLVHENDLSKILEEPGKQYGALNYQSNQFLLTLTGRSIMECHCQMIKVSDMRKINPQMEISKCREGQNFQILLPMLYFYKRCYIEEPLAYYVVRDNSHYHKTRTSEEWIKRYDSLIDMLYETLASMRISPKEADRYVKMSYFWVERERLL